jgi:hypothetical protein
MTSGTARNGIGSGNGPHGSDYRTTPAHMARCQLSIPRHARATSPGAGPTCPWRSCLITG